MLGISIHRIHATATVVTFVAFFLGVCLIWSLGVFSKRHLVATLLSTYLLIWAMLFMVSKTARGEICARFVLTSTALILFIIFLEGIGVVGLVDYQALFPTPAAERWLRPGNSFDEELLHRGEPNFRISGMKRKGNIASSWCLPASSPRYEYDVSLDSKGFRNDIELVRADIAMIGDSYIEGAGIPMEQSTTALLAESTQSAVVNLGRSSYGPQQELVVLKRYALPLTPHTVVWAFYEGNDLHDAFRYDQIKARLARKPKSEPLLWKRSFAANSIEALFHQLKGCTPNSRLRYGVLPSAIQSDNKMYFLDGFQPFPSKEGAWERTLQVLSEAFDLTKAAGIRLVVVFVPTKIRTYRNVLEFPPGSQCLEWKDNDLPQRLASALAQIAPEIGYLDLTPYLVAEARKGRQVYFLDDTHWARDGHRVAANALHDYLSIQHSQSRRDASTLTRSQQESAIRTLRRRE